MNQQSQQPTNGQWVRLHLVAQTEMSTMPTYIEGFLTHETPGSYVLSSVVGTSEDAETYGEPTIVSEMTFINRTYIWCCTVLEESPVLEDDGGTYIPEGGMG